MSLSLARARALSFLPEGSTCDNLVSPTLPLSRSLPRSLAGRAHSLSLLSPPSLLLPSLSRARVHALSRSLARTRSLSLALSLARDLSPALSLSLLRANALWSSRWRD